MLERKDRGDQEVQSITTSDWINFYQAAALLADKTGAILLVNDTFVSLTGYSSEELTNIPLSELISLSSDQSFEYKSINDIQKFTTIIRLSDGSEVYCHVSKSTVSPSTGIQLDLIQFYPFTNQELSNLKSNGHTSDGKMHNKLTDIAHRNKAILETIPDLLILFDSEANVIEVHQNPNFPVPHLGWMLKNKNLHQILPEKSSKIFEKFSDINKSGNPSTFYDNIEFGGETRFLEYRLVSVEGNRILAIVRDITDLRKAEKALYLNQERLRHMQQISGIGSWDATFGEKTTILTWNFFEILGTENPVTELKADHLYHFHLVHPDDLKWYKKTIEESISEKSDSYQADYRIIDNKNNLRHLHTEAKLEFDSLGNLRRWVGTIQDVSTQKKAEILKASAFQISQLIHSQHNLTHLMEAIHQIIASLMPAPNLLVALSDDDSKEIDFPFCIDPKGKPDQESARNGLIGYVLGNGEPLLVSASAIDLMISERIIQKPALIPESWLGIPLKTHDRVLGVLVLQSYTPDITYGEDEKNILNFVSEQIALSILRIGSDEALLNAKNEAEESSRLKSSLLANMSHELRTPMTGILGFSEILHEELEEERLKVMASTIFKSANRLMSTLNSIMDLSAIESNIDSLNIKPVNVKSTFLPQLRNLHSIASDKGIYLRTALPPTITVVADEKLLGQLLHHLLDNAIKFTIDGGVSVSAYVNAQNKSEAIIRVSDTGIGIAPEHHKLIFEEFRQVSEGLSRIFEGSGLGLALCVKIARLINARLWVDSVPDKGSDFYIGLPYVLPDTFEVAVEPEPVQVINTQRLSRGPVPEVLIVEDNEINRRLAALYLRELCNTEMAENGYVALEKIKRKKYDAILMDINLGAGPNGMSIANEVRTLDNYKNTPIIAVTGYTMQGDREKLLSNGCSHYLAKPYDKKTLLRLFSGILYG